MHANRTRLLDWPALFNARDLGGLPAAGGATRFGALVRSDTLRRLTEPGWAALRAHGVTTILDQRAPTESRNWSYPVGDHATYRNMPFMDDAALASVGARFEVDGDNYLWQLEHEPRRIGAILTAIADAPPGGVLIHCAAGKDRTGLVTALALSVAGVDRETVVADYALTQAAMAPMLEEQLAAEPDRSRWDRMRVAYRCRPELLTAVLAELDSRHGGVAGYLDRAGVDDAKLDRIRTRLVDS
jgi:protein tyrosine/serine phosphatase